MKKMVFMAAFVAATAAFVACSSNDDLVQQAPEVPEVKGTPFSISVGADTRATLYNADAWGTTGENTKVTMLKLYGKQTDQTTPWLNNVVFTRASTSTDWSANRDAEHDALGDEEKPTWPKTGNSIDSSVDTKFYAITDNAIGDGTTATISNVDAGTWMAHINDDSPVASFGYTMAFDTDNLPHIDKTSGTGYIVDVETSFVMVSELKDLMVASATTNEEGTTNGELNLVFNHVLAGLNIKAIFRNDGVYDGHQAYLIDPENADENSGKVLIHYIKIMGLKTSGTYNLGTGSWSGLSDELCYYKSFSTPIEVNAFREPTSDNAEVVAESIATADEDKWLVNQTDPWMVIPQKTDPWDAQGCDTESAEYIATGKAYVVLGITDHVDTENIEIFLPLDTEFVAGKNKTLRLDLGKFRDLYQNSTGEAPYYFTPASGGGGARGYDFIDE